ncbi:MAG: site-specific integrase, partial [Bacteroidota bacterium]
MEEFLHYMTHNNASPYTIRARKTALRSFIAFAATQGIAHAEEVTYRTMADFTMHMGLRLSPLSRNQRISIMRVFFRYLCQSNHILYDPAERMESVKAHRILPEHVLSPADAEKILSGI